MHIRFPLLLERGYSNVIDELCMRAQVPLYSSGIKLERGLVTVLDSRRKDPETYADMTELLNK